LQHEYAIHFVEMVYGFYKAGAPNRQLKKNLRLTSAIPFNGWRKALGDWQKEQGSQSCPA
jgi:hypothetical protein